MEATYLVTLFQEGSFAESGLRQETNLHQFLYKSTGGQYLVIFLEERPLAESGLRQEINLHQCLYTSTGGQIPGNPY
jgi:hypothetical protein